MPQEVVEKREKGYYIRGSRIALDSIVYPWRQGSTVEEIQRAYPSLDAREVKEAVEFYLANRAAVDAWIEESEREEGRMQAESKAVYPDLIERVEEVRREFHARR